MDYHGLERRWEIKKEQEQRFFNRNYERACYQLPFVSRREELEMAQEEMEFVRSMDSRRKSEKDHRRHERLYNPSLVKFLEHKKKAKKLTKTRK